MINRDYVNNIKSVKCKSSKLSKSKFKGVIIDSVLAMVPIVILWLLLLDWLHIFKLSDLIK